MLTSHFHLVNLQPGLVNSINVSAAYAYIISNDFWPRCVGVEYNSQIYQQQMQLCRETASNVTSSCYIFPGSNSLFAPVTLWQVLSMFISICLVLEKDVELAYAGTQFRDGYNNYNSIRITVC